jgi:hypothetical protein
VRTFGIGQPLEGTEQQWLVSGDDALLVDRWVARALDPDPLALRVRHPVENAQASWSLELLRGELRIQVDDETMTAPVRVLPRRELLAALYRAIEALEIVRLSRPPPDGDLTLAVFDTVALRVAPQCPEDPTLAWLSSDAGNGCITRSAYDELMRTATAFEAPAAQLAEPRLVPFDVEAVVLADGAKLELARRPEINGGPADTEAVSELLAALATPAQVIDSPGGAVKAQVTVTRKGGSVVVLELLGAGRVRRAGEPVVLQLAPAAYTALNRRAADLADRAVWIEEATTITELVIDGVAYGRGAVLGEWTRTPPGPVDGARVEAVVTALAEVRGAPEVGMATKQHEVAIVVTPPAGAPVRHELVVGAAQRGGCPARAGQVTVILTAPVCAEIAALAR